MTNIKVPALIFIICTCITSSPSSPQRGFSHGANHQILATIDAVFITLKINENFTKSQNIAEYLSMHHFVQDAVQKNDQIYQRIRRNCKTKFSNKNASHYSNIDEVIEETINNQKAKITEFFKNYNLRNNAAWIYDELRNSFLKLTKDFHLKINTLPNDIKLLASDINNIRPESRRIFMGKPTTISRFPFVASIHVHGRFTCVGALFDEDLVITAASCFLEFISISPLIRVTYIKVRVGSDFTNKQGQLLPVAGLHLHPAFNTTDLSHNLAVVHLEQRPKLQKNAITCIKFDRIAQGIPTDVKSVVILGWGEKKVIKNIGNVKNIVSDEKLEFQSLELYDLDECEDIYTKYGFVVSSGQNYISGKLFCAGSVDRGSGACQNDVGAPAIVGNTLVGVTSFGAPRCGQRDAPTVFTKVGFYTAWIDGIYKKIHKKDSNAAAYNNHLNVERESVNKQKPKKKYFEDIKENDDSHKKPELNGGNLKNKKDPKRFESTTDVDYGKFVFDISSSTITTRINRDKLNRFTKINESPPRYSSEEKKEEKEVVYVSEDQILKYYRQGRGDKAEVEIRESGTTQRYLLDKKIPKIQKVLENLKKLFAQYKL